MGTGLGPGELRDHRAGAASANCSGSKPYAAGHHRGSAGITALQEQEAAGRVALESAKQNLARVATFLKSHTADEQPEASGVEAERFAAVRDELRGRLRVVLGQPHALMDADQARLGREIAALTERINASSAGIEEREGSQHTLTERGYQLDGEGQEAQNRAQHRGCRAGAGRGAGTRQY